MRWLSRAFRRNARAPRDVDACLRAALLAVLDRDLGRAEELLQRAARLDTSCEDAFLALARLYRSRGEIGRAIRIHQNLLLDRRDDPEGRLVALGDLAADFRQGGFLRRAIAAYEEVLSRDPRHEDALRSLARLYAEARDHDRAVDAARRLARIEGRRAGPEEAVLRVEQAEAAHAEGRSEDARRAVKRALRRDKGCVRAWVLLGTLEAEHGRSKAALAAWSRVPKLDRRAGGLVYPQIEAGYAALGKARDYEAYLRKLLNEQTDDPAARIALAHSLAARGEVDDAAAELRRVLERDPEDLEARIALGRLLLSEHRDHEAAKEFGELLDVLDRQRPFPRRESLA